MIVTRGNVNLKEILASLPFEDVVIWDNSKQREDVSVYGRYMGIKYVAAKKKDLVAVQDDDAIVDDWPAILAAYEPGKIVCNMAVTHRAYYEPMGLGLVGFGGVFSAALAMRTFERYFAKWPKDELFLRECDRVFTGLNELIPVTFPYRNLPHEKTTPRMWRESRHGDDLVEIRKRIEAVRQSAQ